MLTMFSRIFFFSLLIQGVPAPFGEGKRQCVGFIYGICVNTPGGFTLTVTSSDTSLEGAGNFVEINGNCLGASYQGTTTNLPPLGTITGGVIIGISANGCAGLGLNALQVYSAGGQLCNRCAFRRRLSSPADEVFELEQGTVNYDVKRLETCKDFEYEGYLHVDDHFTLYALPGEEARSANCPMIAAHVEYPEQVDSDCGPIKEGLLWNDPHQGLKHFDDALFIGKWTAGEIVNAAEVADHTDGSSMYNIISNNCAIFAVNMARHLNVNVDSKITGYVTRRLLEHSSVVESIRGSYRDFFGNRNLRGDANDMNDEELVELVVEARALDML